MNPLPHQAVLIHPVIEAFRTVPLTLMVDGTLGAGGHAAALLQEHPEIEHYLGIDQDPEALHIAAERLRPWGAKVILKQGNFADFDQFIKELSLPRPNGILLDLGVSSMQLDQAQRGFSFMREGPLDMRMNPLETLTAHFIVNNWSEKDLGRIIRDYGEEKQWRTAVRAIMMARELHPIETTVDLATILSQALGRFSKKGIHPATLVFQALRICVNHELDVLEQGLSKAIDLLLPHGRLAVISFHSLEDRIVKEKMQLAASDKWETSGLGGGLFRDKKPTAKLVVKKPLIASEQESNVNPRSRSAKLRILEKLEETV